MKPWSKYCISLLIILAYLSELAIAQTTFRHINLNLEASTFLSSSNQVPFWLRANQYGTVPNESKLGQFQVLLKRPYQSNDTIYSLNQKKFDYGFGLNPVINLVKNKTQFIYPEAYFKIRVQKLELAIGSRKQVIGLGDSTLSSGNMINSQNAIPIPKIFLGSLGFITIPIWQNLLSVNGGISVGLNNDNYIKNAYLHQKYFYIKLGKPKSRVNFFIGIHHEVMWGGEAEYLKLQPDIATNGKLPSSLKYFGNIFLGTRPKISNNLSAFDQDYRIGNHVGTYDFGITADLKKAGDFFLYHQHIFEDVSGATFKNIPDGLYGLSWKPKYTKAARWQLKKVVLEYMHALSQSGSSFLVPNSTYQGNDNYFNHSQYFHGWSFKDRTKGNPLFVPRPDLPEKITKTYPNYFPSNRIRALYLAFESSINKQIELTGKLSASKNFGTNDFPFIEPLNQYSALVGVEYRIPKFYNSELGILVAKDAGNYLNKNTGLRLVLRKSF